MRHVLVAALGFGLLVIAGGDARAARFTNRLDGVQALVTARQADAATTAALAKVYGKALKKLGKDTTSLAAEVKTAAGVIGSLEKKAAADAEVQAAAAVAVDGLLVDVTAALAKAEADAAALAVPKKKNPLIRINNLIAAGRTNLALVPATTGLKARLQLILRAASSVGRAASAIGRMGPPGGGGGGGGGGGSGCGPTDPFAPQGRRALLAGESFTATVTDFQSTYTFTAGSVATELQTFSGITYLQITAYDCTERSMLQVLVTFPPPALNVPATVTNNAYQEDWDQTVAAGRGGTITWIAFDAAAKTGAATFTSGVATNGQFSLRQLTP